MIKQLGEALTFVHSLQSELVYLQSKTEAYWEKLETFFYNKQKRIHETEILIRFLDSVEAWLSHVKPKFEEGYFDEDHQIMVKISLNI